MFCGLAVAAVLFSSVPAALQTEAPAPAGVAAIAQEPLFAELVQRSGSLKTIVDGWIASGAANQSGFIASAAFIDFKTQAAELAERNMQGHVVLRERGSDDDLKCILRGIAEDLPVKIAAVEAAPNEGERKVALEELAYLLNDNVEVITSPPQPTATARPQA
jgi:hypothetical protein